MNRGDAPNDPHQSALEHPNILLIVADDMGYTDLGALVEKSRRLISTFSQSQASGLQIFMAPRCAPGEGNADVRDGQS